jgi:ATP-dependent Clp protease ATP-binding subunit ClpB
MRPEKMTSRLQGALADAQSLALGNDHSALEAVHLLAVLVEQKQASCVPLLVRAGARESELRQRLADKLDALARLSNPTGEVSLSPGFVKVMNLADRLAQKAGDDFLSTEQVLLAFWGDPDTAEILRESGVGEQSLEDAIKETRSGETVSDPNAEEHREALEKYTVDLTAQAEAGKLDPVIGRDDEIRRTVQVLQRRTKNNV